MYTFFYEEVAFLNHFCKNKLVKRINFQFLKPSVFPVQKTDVEYVLLLLA